MAVKEEKYRLGVIFNKLSGDADTAGPWTTLGVLRDMTLLDLGPACFSSLCPLSLPVTSCASRWGLTTSSLCSHQGDFELAVSPAGTLPSSLVIKSSDNKIVSLWSDFVLKAFIWIYSMFFWMIIFFGSPLLLWNVSTMRAGKLCALANIEFPAL